MSESLPDESCRLTASWEVWGRGTCLGYVSCFIPHTSQWFVPPSGWPSTPPRGSFGYIPCGARFCDLNVFFVRICKPPFQHFSFFCLGLLNGFRWTVVSHNIYVILGRGRIPRCRASGFVRPPWSPVWRRSSVQRPRNQAGVGSKTMTSPGEGGEVFGLLFIPPRLKSRISDCNHVANHKG